ncbi:hypothetical protein [Flavobacterium columnare]|uniref:hypothetical protein n=1 Tax=Flavobacterium columnare TaxID=996 RepID=UPI003BA29EEE
MKYNQKNIYQNYGQFDNIVTIIIYDNTEEFKKYGKSLTGQIRYKKEERDLLQKSLMEEVNLENLTNLKIDDNISKLNSSDKFDLFYDGITLESIQLIFSFPFSSINAYTYDEIRKMPEPMLIQYDSRDLDPSRAIIWLNNQRKKDGFLLTSFEEKQNIAYQIISNNYIIPNKLIEFESDKEVRYYVLDYKYLYSDLTEVEDKEHKELLSQKVKESVEILFNILKQESNNDLSFLNGRKDIVQILTTLVTYFKPERLTSTKVPVWWNLERYLHIILGHVSGLQFCIKNKDNTSFQYHFKDIKELIKDILISLSKEIDLHFEQFPNKDFKRQGGMSYYYKGDFYVIHIRKDGLLQTIYKNN